jgi:hypothetical protein
VTTKEPPEDMRGPEFSAGDATPHWEEIAPGRFQPRRTRGSYPGRELG